MNPLEPVQLPELPKLNAGYVVVQNAAWKTLIDYVNAQTSTINALARTVSALSNLMALNKAGADIHLKTLSSEISEIAKALEGAYDVL